jgi:hypothetical protein
MARKRKSRSKLEFGDFQTPPDLARKVCQTLSRQGISPRAILEPNCGRGNLLVAALETFPDAKQATGVEINGAYAQEASEQLERLPHPAKTEIIHGDFFAIDWREILASLQDPILILGNPPWVTNAELGRIESANLPEKTNVQNVNGIEAITGKSNFDISEWMISRELEWLQDRNGVLAMLCKTSVARKALLHAWQNHLHISRAMIFNIDAASHFGAAVDACLLVVSTEGNASVQTCQVYASLDDRQPSKTIGYQDGKLIADVECFERWRHLLGKDDHYQWRSGVKHDAAQVMELTPDGNRYRNGLGETIELEQTHLYPMYKSSEIANGSVQAPARWMLIPQRSVADNTQEIRLTAPKTWRYLMAHAAQLDARKSAIYRNRSRFAVFGVGDYTFAPWKVAISGFYKFFRFRVFGPWQNKPVVFDDTSYFLACRSEEEAEFLARLLNSEPAQEFYSAFVFWDAKRPITISLLRLLNILALARELDVEDIYNSFHVGDAVQPQSTQMLLPL